MPSLNLIKIENVWFINIRSLFSALLLSMRLPSVSGINCLNSLLLQVAAPCAHCAENYSIPGEIATQAFLHGLIFLISHVAE